MPFTSSWKKNVMPQGPARPSCCPARAGHEPARAVAAISVQLDQLLGISWYWPPELILDRKNLPLTRAPWESNLIGCPRIVAGSFVFLICASTLARLGVWPDLQTAAIASSITCVAAKLGGPNVPWADPYFAF